MPDEKPLVSSDVLHLRKDPRPVRDLSAETTNAITEADRLLAEDSLDAAVQLLMVTEKIARQSYDAKSVTALCLKVLELYKSRGDWAGVMDNVSILSKRRAQLKKPIVAMVDKAVGWLEEDGLVAETHRMPMMEAIAEITQGKIVVEVQRARLVKKMAAVKEAQGDVQKACTLLQNVQIEAIGGIEKIEKTDYILEQMRLALAVKDFVRLQIISKKISTKLLEDSEFQDAKIAYYRYTVCYHIHEDDLLEVCQSYKAMLKTVKLQKDTEACVQTLEEYLLFLILAKSSTSQKKLLAEMPTIFKEFSKLSGEFRRLYDDFVSLEIVRLPLSYAEDGIASHVVFTDRTWPGGEERQQTFRKRFIQKNVEIFAMYYTSVHLSKIASLTNVESREVEAEIPGLVNEGLIYARIDRPTGVVVFSPKSTAIGLLNDWSASIHKALRLVEQSCHLVEKERMIHQANNRRQQPVFKKDA